MAVFSGPEIVNNGLVFHYDMGNIKKSWIGRPTTNTINTTTTAINRYNNPGFSGTVSNTGLTYRGAPIYELTFIPQDSSFISRLAGTEGFGALHSMGIPLQADTRYMASIYVRSDHPLQVSATEGFNNGYSNIPGWNQNGTTSTIYREDGWIRLYSQYFNNTDGYSTRGNTFQTNFTVNTTSTQTVDVNFTVPSNGSGITNFEFLHALVSASPSIVSNGGLTGLSIIDHGLDTTSFTKLSWPNTIKLKSSDLPFNYFVRLSVPSTGGVNTTISLRANFTGYYTALTDSKYWKLTFDTTNVSVGQVLRTYWCAPMIEQHDTVWPSTFINGTRSNTESILDLTRNNTFTANSLTYNADGSFSFVNTSENNIVLPNSVGYTTNNVSCFAWFKRNGAPSGGFHIVCGGQELEISIPEPGGSLRVGVFSGTRFVSNHGSGLLDGNWHYIGFTSDGTTKTAYIDGVNVGTQSITGTLTTSFANRAIGKYGSSTQYYANGDIGAYKIYKRALTAAEIQQNFEATRSRYGL
jgi:hypothetical protein